MRVNELEWDDAKRCRIDGLPAEIIGWTNNDNQMMLIVRTKLGEIKPVAPSSVHLETEPEDWEWADPIPEEEDDDEVVIPRRTSSRNRRPF